MSFITKLDFKITWKVSNGQKRNDCCM